MLNGSCPGCCYKPSSRIKFYIYPSSTECAAMHGDRWSKMGSPTTQCTAFSPTATGSVLSDPGPWQG